LICAAVLAVAFRRGLGSLAQYQRPYAELVKIGRWSGALRTHVSDTPFELSDTLGRQVPHARDAIHDVTAAYVEGTYASRLPSADPWPSWLAARRDVVRALLRRRLSWFGDGTSSDAPARARPELLRQWGASASRRNRSTRSK